MLGRAAYHTPAILAGADELIGAETLPIDHARVVDAMAAHAAAHIEAGGRLVHVTRHMTGLFNGYPGARRYRQILASEACRPGAGVEVLFKAFAAVDIETEPKAA